MRLLRACVMLIYETKDLQWILGEVALETVGLLVLTIADINSDFYGDCSQEIKRRLPFGRKAMTNLDSMLKSRDIILPTKAHLVKAMVFPVVVYGCESWTITKAECQRIDAFELWCWRRLFENPLDCKDIQPVILKEITSEYSLEGLMLKLRRQYFGYLM